MGIYSKHNIEVTTTFTTMGDGRIRKAIKEVQDLGNGTTKTKERVTEFNQGVERTIRDTETASKKMGGFQMEQLGVMFAGMALNRAMSNLNSTSREWLGIGDLMSDMMGITMLEANMDLLEYGVLPLFDALTNLPPEAQKAIGYVSFALEGLGGVMMTGGQLMLGLGATIQMLEKIGGAGGVAAGARTALTKLAGVGLVTVGVTLGVGSIMSEGGKSVLMALGSALAMSIGGILLGATLTGGIVIGGITLAAIAAVKMTIDDIEYREDLKKRMEDKLYETATPAEQALSGFSPTGGQGTMINYGNEYGQRNIDLEIDPLLFAGYQSKAVGGKIRSNGLYYMHEGEEVVSKGETSGGIIFRPTYNVTVSDRKEFEDIIKKNNTQFLNKIKGTIR